MLSRADTLLVCCVAMEGCACAESPKELEMPRKVCLKHKVNDQPTHLAIFGCREAIQDLWGRYLGSYELYFTLDVV